MGVNISTQTVHNVDCVVTLELPRSGLERVRQVVEGTHWAQFNRISWKFIVNHWFNISGNLIRFTSRYLAKSKFTSYQLCESHATSAVNTSCHWSLNEWSKVFVFNTSLVFHKTTFCVTINSWNVLKIALAALIADRTIEGMVCKQELHYTTTYV